MGQYYQAINLDKKERLSPYAGAKLMEHSWCWNNMTTHFSNLLAGRWKGDRVIWAGDYTENDMFVEDMPDRETKGAYGPQDIYDYATERYEDINLGKGYNEWNKTCKSIEPDPRCNIFANLDTKEYVDIRHCPTKEGWKIFPVSLLITTCNHSGGSYYGDNQEKCGMWLGNHIAAYENLGAFKKELGTAAKEFNEIKPDFQEQR